MPDEVIDTVRFITIGSTHGYRPKPVRRKEIPKPYDPTKTRPLGIPCVWGPAGTTMYQAGHGAEFVKRNSAKTVKGFSAHPADMLLGDRKNLQVC